MLEARLPLLHSSEYPPVRTHYRFALLFWLLVLCLIPARSSFAQFQLRVLDPQRNWTSDQGTIEEAVLSVQPKGVYMEYGLYLTFSARGTQFSTSSIPIEVEMFFSLPDEAVVTDSWLWIEDEIIRATIMDQWTASSIYEEVVSRQRDPSILFKRGPGSYELRIYPMPGNGSRKVKLTYLMPATWSATRASVPIPTQLLRTSKFNLSKVHVLTYPSEKWSSPAFVELPGLSFVEKSDNEFGSYLQAGIPASALTGALRFAVDVPLRDGAYVSATTDGESGWYQMALLPSLAVQEGAASRVAFVIDYDAGRTNIGRQTVLDALRAQVLSALSAADSFNVFFSQLEVQRASERWLPADSATVQSVFKGLSPDRIGTYSSLPPLLAESIGFVNAGGPGTVLLLSSSERVGDVSVANQVIADLRASVATLPPIHVADFADRNLTTYWVGGQSYTANSYLFTNLARLTGGNYLTMRSPARSFESLLFESFGSLAGSITAFDLHTTLENGFCFGRFGMNSGELVVARRPVLQIGRFHGEFPFIADMSGLYQSVPFSQRAQVAKEDVFAADTTLVSLWTGRQIQTLEAGPQTNDVVNEIVNYSIDRRVLSLYTAFLALEPDRGGQVCYNCVDESSVVPVEPEAPPREDAISAYPNPFVDKVTIDVRLGTPVEAALVTATVYNVLGQTVRVLRSTEGGLVSSLTLTWDGTDAAGRDVPSGTYLLVLETPTARHTLSLVRVR